MTTPITGEKFIRTLRHYLEANQHRLLSSQPNFNSSQPTPAHPPTIKEEPVKENNGLLKAVSSLWNNNNNNNTSSSSSRPITPANSSNDTIGSRPTSLYGIPIPYMSLLAATSPNATALSNVPYMPLRSSLTLDIHYLYFLLVQFEYLGLEDTHLPVPANGLVETETTTNAETDNTKKPPSISSIGSVMSTLSLSTGWQFWSNKQTQQGERPLHEDIVWIHRYLAKVTALKLHLNLFTDKGVTRSGQRTIRGYEHPMALDGSISLSLKCFKHLQYLELSNVHPRCIEDWATLKTSLTSLTIKGANVDNATDVVGQEEPWTQLKMLSLSDNSLTTLDHEPTQLLRSLTHLNLSSNLLIDTPASLATLYNLSSLNLSHNMISFTTGIYTVLGNIQELDLRGNRLTMLAGIDRLWALERLDVRDNRIEDVDEVGRLTALPNIYDIWVDGNPFTKFQPEYRVCIFTTFKQNDLDIELDGTKPSFTERRRIHVDDQHHNNTPTVSATIAADTVTPKWPTPIAPSQHQQEQEEQTNQDKPVTMNVSPTMVKSKKLARAKSKSNKRQIRLGQVIEDIPVPAAAMAEQEHDKKHMHRLADLEEAVQQEHVSARRAASVRSRRSKKGSAAEEKALTAAIMGGEAAIPNNSSEEFRKKIEAMRREAGTEWLRVLQEMDVVKKTP